MTLSLVSTKVQIKISASYRNTLSDGTTIVNVAVPNASYADALTSGSETGQADRAWQIVEDLLAAHDAIATYDLATMGGTTSGTNIGAGAGCDPLGQPINFHNVVAILIVNENAVGAIGQLEITPSADRGWTPIGSHTVATGGALKAGGMLFKYNPAEGGFDIGAVGAGSSYRIRLRASGGPVYYSMYLLCRSEDIASSSSSLSSSSLSSSSMSASSLSHSSVSSLSSSSLSSLSASHSSLSTQSTSQSSISSQSTSQSSLSSLSASSLSSLSLSSSSQSSSSLSP